MTGATTKSLSSKDNGIKDKEYRYFSHSVLLLFAHYSAVMAITKPKLQGRPNFLHLFLNFCYIIQK